MGCGSSRSKKAETQASGAAAPPTSGAGGAGGAGLVSDVMDDGVAPDATRFLEFQHRTSPLVPTKSENELVLKRARELRVECLTAEVAPSIPFHQMAETNDLDGVREFAKCTDDITEIWDEDGWSALHWAASAGHAEMIHLLVSLGFNVNATDREGCTPLHWAADNGHVVAIDALVELGADVNVVDKFKQTPLYDASSRLHDACIKQLIDRHNADPSKASSTGKRPVTVYCEVHQQQGSVPDPEVLLLLRRVYRGTPATPARKTRVSSRRGSRRRSKHSIQRPSASGSGTGLAALGKRKSATASDGGLSAGPSGTNMRRRRSRGSVSSQHSVASGNGGGGGGVSKTKRSYG